jgi:hypothetical protein
MSFKWNLICHNVTYLVFNIFSSKWIFLGPYTASPVIAALIEAFREVRGLKLGKCIPWFCLNHVCMIKSILLNSILSYGEREKSSGANWCGKTLKLLLKVLAHVIIHLLCPEQAGYRFGRNLMCIQIVIQKALNYPNEIHSVLGTSQIVILLFLKTNDFTQSTFSSVLISGCRRHSAPSADVTLLSFYTTTQKLAFSTLSALQ